MIIDYYLFIPIVKEGVFLLNPLSLLEVGIQTIFCRDQNIIYQCLFIFVPFNTFFVFSVQFRIIRACYFVCNVYERIVFLYKSAKS